MYHAGAIKRCVIFDTFSTPTKQHTNFECVNILQIKFLIFSNLIDFNQNLNLKNHGFQKHNSCYGTFKQRNLKAELTKILNIA